MYPFYDENYYGNPHFLGQGLRSMSPMNSLRNMHSMPYGNMTQPFQQLSSTSSLNRIMGGMTGFRGLTLKSTLNSATKTIGTINQVIPIVNQARPIFNNAKNAFRIMKAVKNVNSLTIDDLDEIDDAIKDDTKDAIIINDTTEKEATSDNQIFENML